MRAGMRGTALTTTAMVIAAVVMSIVASSPAAATAYRYWTYWQARDGVWAFATAGPATTVPADGAVEGWRFAVTTASGRASDQPQAAPDFASICAGTPAQEGRKRLALVLDFGPPDVAPSGETPPALATACVVADADATSSDMLRSVATVRTNDVGLVCALQDYPRSGCAELVDEVSSADAEAAPTPAAPATPSSPSPSSTTTSPVSTTRDASSPAPTIMAFVIIGAMAVTAIVVARRRRA